jgi:uncharacterized Zn finger protein
MPIRRNVRTNKRAPLRNVYWGVEATEALPVEDGVLPHSQEGQFSKSWWGRLWLRALGHFISPTKLARGRAYARHGQVMSLETQVGLVRARVQGTRPTPYRVRIEIKALSNADWDRALEAIASQAIYAAQLLNGEMPRDIEEVFRAIGASLFPLAAGDLRSECTCPDPATPCKHVAAVCLLLSERLDEEPFLLFALRGRTQEQVMAALRAWRAERAVPATSERRRESGDGSTSRASSAVGEENLLSGFWQLGPEVETLPMHLAAPEVEMEALKVLGDPTFAEDETLAQRLAEVYRAVSRRALEVAFGEHHG